MKLNTIQKLLYPFFQNIIERKDKEIFNLECYKKCSLNFMRETGINPIILGYDSMYSKDRKYCYNFNRVESEQIISKIDVRNNPTHNHICKMFQQSVHQ